MTDERTALEIAKEKLDAFKVSLHEKVFAEYTLEQVDAAVEVAAAVLPRVKNYFTRLDKCFKMLVNKTPILVQLVEYSIKNPEVEFQTLAYSLRQAAGQKTVTDEALAELLTDGTFEIVKPTRRRRAAEEYDFTL